MQVTPNEIRVPPISLTEETSLSRRDLERFARFGITQELLKESGVRRVSDREARDEYGIRGSVTMDMSGIVFPYYNLTGDRVTARLRRDNPEIENGKPKNKYISAFGDRKRLYLLPGPAEKLQDPETPIVLVEAETSALALTAWAERMGINLLAIAMGGCWGWRGRIGKVENSKGVHVDEKGPLSDLDCVNGRKVYVLLDANAASNGNVQAARTALIRELRKRSCEVMVCELPIVDGVNGPDDYIAICGDNAMDTVFAEARNIEAAIAHHEYGGGRFEVSDRGVVYFPADKDGESKTPVWICAPLRVKAKTRDCHSKEWGRLLEWHDADGVQHQWAMPAELLQHEAGADVRCELARQGLDIAPGRKAWELLVKYLQVWPSEARVRCVDKLGWHGPVYVLPAGEIGDATERVVFQNAHAIEPAFDVSGTTDDWREHVAGSAKGNSRMMFAISVAFAGPLLEPARQGSGGFHLRGPSSTGKSTALVLAASVWGEPELYCRNWRATSNGLEGLAALHNDGLLILDELGQIEAKDAGEAAYLLANGQGKARAARNGTARQAASWQLLFLSAGELSLSSHMAEAGRMPTAGQEIRMAEIDADAGAGMGVFEDLNGFNNPGELALSLRDGAFRYYGAVGAEWLRLVVADRSKLSEVLVEGIRQFTQEFVPKGSDGQVERVARRFGLVAMAGEIATRSGLTGWGEKQAIEAVGKCFESWLENFGGKGNREERSLLDQVRAFVEKNGSSRFEDWSSDFEQRIVNRAGFWRINEKDQTREYLVFPEAFKREICVRVDPKFAVKVLQKHGWLAPGHDGRAAQRVRLHDGTPTWFYVLTAKMWEGGE